MIKLSKVIEWGFCIALFIFFMVSFGYPSIEKYFEHEVFIKISAEPKDRSKVYNISLPGFTFCGSEVSSEVSQVKCKKSFKYFNYHKQIKLND